MKILLVPLLLMAGLNLAQAENAPLATPPTAEQVRSTWQSLTPEQKAAWGALSDEENSARKAATKAQLQPYRSGMQSKMQACMSHRPFGRR